MDRREYVSAHIDVSPGSEKRLETPSSDTPFRFLLLGDFSGRGNRTTAAEPRLRGRKPIAVDLDNFDDVLARMRPQLELPGPDEPIHIQFETLEDFHPDALCQNVPLLQNLLVSKESLLEARPAKPRPAPAAAAGPPPEVLSSGSLLDDILGGVETPARKRPPDAWSQHIQDIVAPHLEARPDARQSELAARIGDTIDLAMRVVLHHPGFQDLEAAWRSVDFLLRRLELGSDLQLHIVDLSRQELLEDLSKAPDLQSTGLYRLLVEEAAGSEGGEPWAVIAGLYTFDAEPADIRTLGSLGRLARAAGAPFLCSLSPRFMGTESFGTQPDADDWQTPLGTEAEAEWNTLRSAPEAGWIGAALPRFLLRYPYGKDAGSVDAFAFEEMAVPPDHANFLWGNPAVACVCLIGESFAQDGWNVELRNTQISGLPLHTYVVDGEAEMTPCAECWMSERTVERFVNRGIMPLASIKRSDSVRLIRLQSIARPAAKLCARWNQ